MTFNKTLKLLASASVSALVLVACSDTTISSPGIPTAPVAPVTPVTPPTASAINLMPTAGCPAGTSETTYAAITADSFASIDVCALGSATGTTTLTTDITIPANTTIALQGPVFIGQDNKDGAGSAATLTIGEGVRFFGASASGSSGGTDDYLVVSRGSSIVANGTATSPIRFTSRAAINDDETNSSLIQSNSTAQWGGLIINGLAPINACEDSTATGGSAACEKSGEGSSGLFGGADSNDNSGTLRYVIVEYAGARLTNTDELNGIAFQGVGDGTTVEYVQVHNNLDDGIEWFGGTVNAKYVAITGAGDDSIDWTDGWTGRLQFAAVRSTNPTSGDPRGIEGDNLSGDNAATPFSNPKIANYTLVGSAGNQQGQLVRRGSQGTIINGIVTGFNPGLDVDDTQSFTHFTNGDLVFKSIALDNDDNFASDADGVPAFVAADNVRGYSNSLQDNVFPGTQEAGFPASNALAGDAFFSAANYVGAFGPAEDATNSWADFTLPGTLFDSITASCPSGTAENGTLDGKILCTIDSAVPITSDLRLTNGDQLIYELDGAVFVGVDQGADPAAPLAGSAAGSLTIDGGVTVVGADNDDYLVVTRGSQIFSNGTAARPVVFTAKGELDGTATIDTDTKGLWGGIIINGRAPINACENGAAVGGTVGCEKSGEGSSGLFGGASTDDDSGQILYTRVQYAGSRLTNTDELNGIAFQGTGSGLEVDYVQVYNNLDDCFEFFGGTTNAKHLIALGCGDDSLDWTDGFQGSIQYAIVYSGVSSATGGLSGDPRGIEGDNLSGDNSATPISAPRVSNFTLVSGGDAAADTGAVLRRGMQGTIANGIILDWPDAGIDVDDASTNTNFANGDLQIQSLFLSGNGEDIESGDADDVTFAAGNNVTAGQAITTTGFTFRTGRPSLVPGANENAVTVFDVTGIGALEPTTYIGAVENAADTWFRGWSIDQTATVTASSIGN